ncbi:YTH domain-containing protein ECT2 [Linum perenne]
MLSSTVSSVPSRDAKPSAKRDVDVTSGIKGAQMESFGQQPLYNPPTSTYGYYYPGYSAPFPQVDDHGYFQADGSHVALQSDNGQMIYYMPGYNPYSPGQVVGVDGQTASQQQFYPPSEYIQHPVSYGSEAFPCYQWDSTYHSEISNGNAGVGTDNHSRGGATLPKSNGLNSMKTNGSITSKYPNPSSTQASRPLNKVSPFSTDYSAGLLSGYNNGVGKPPTFSGQSHYALTQYGSMNYRQNARSWNVNDRNKPRYRTQRNGSFESSNELSCGPRAANKSAPTDPAVKDDNPFSLFRKDQYNLQDFGTVYKNAKFYVIKSYSEDDIHKSIKYNVWSSTTNGNKKLDAAFRESEEKASESGSKCPVFLFFSVNGSGQFVGLAEMVGQVDFNKDMDFWQLNKWNGFFPVKWHVVKDIPNNQLRHIILENNENKPVTFSRDTQEIGMKQGLEMLSIFKSYSQKSSLIDDFNFYETREKSLSAKKNSKPTGVEAEAHENGEVAKYAKTGEERSEEDVKIENEANLVDLTKNLTINGCCHPKENAVIEPIENGVAPAAAIVAAAAP